MKFYFVAAPYLESLRQVDSNVMEIKNINYIRQKFVFGAVIIINNYKYYVPVSSIKQNQLIDKNTLSPEFASCSYPIFNHQITGYHISAILRFNFMFPVPANALTELIINRLPTRHKNLVQKQYSYLRNKNHEIAEQAKQIYNDVVTGTTLFNKYCDFNKLEIAHDNWLMVNNDYLSISKKVIRL